MDDEIIAIGINVSVSDSSFFRESRVLLANCENTKCPSLAVSTLKLIVITFRMKL